MTDKKHYGSDSPWPIAEGGGVTVLIFTAVWLAAIYLWRRVARPVTGLLALFISGLWLLVLYFFRDPNREVTQAPGVVVSPGDGEVVVIAREPEKRYLQTDVVRISIFLSITNVHVQRVPLSGRVTLVHHRPGQFLQAFRPEASEVNEYIAMELKSDYGRVLVKQIAGIMARRCVNYMVPGDMVETGQRFGLIRFGSRVDLHLPANAQLLVDVGDTVYGGLTPIARLTRALEEVHVEQ